MNNKRIDNESPLTAIKNDSTRARWELFHQAIAYAKESNSAALRDNDPTILDPARSGPRLSIVR